MISIATRVSPDGGGNQLDELKSSGSGLAHEIVCESSKDMAGRLTTKGESGKRTVSPTLSVTFFKAHLAHTSDVGHTPWYVTAKGVVKTFRRSNGSPGRTVNLPASGQTDRMVARLAIAPNSPIRDLRPRVNLRCKRGAGELGVPGGAARPSDRAATGPLRLAVGDFGRLVARRGFRRRDIDLVRRC